MVTVTANGRYRYNLPVKIGEKSTMTLDAVIGVVYRSYAARMHWEAASEGKIRLIPGAFGYDNLAITAYDVHNRIPSASDIHDSWVENYHCDFCRDGAEGYNP